MSAELPEPPLDKSPPTRPLSILDLMLWTFASALTLTVQKLLPEHMQGPTQHSVGAVSACLMGAAVAAALRLGLRWRRGERPMLLHPGHWLMWNAGLMSILFWLHTYVLFWWLQASQKEPNSLEYAMANLAGYLPFLLIAMVLNAVACWNLASDPTRAAWRCFFGLRLVTCSIQLAIVTSYVLTFAVFDFLNSVPLWIRVLEANGYWIWALIDPLELIMLASVAAYDRWRGTPRDWLHYAGVAILSGMSLLAIARYVAFWLMR